MSRFDVTQVRISAAGEQAFVLDAHCTTRALTVLEVISLSIGGLAVYCYDLTAARTFATAWRQALEFAHRVVPETVAVVPGAPSGCTVGALVRIAGAPERQLVNGIPRGTSPTGQGCVRVELGSLVVEAHDIAAVRSYAAAWSLVEEMAERLWPCPDAFDEAENQARARIARRGAAAARRR